MRAPFMKRTAQPPLYLLLASMSRYRAECLAKLHIKFDQWAPHVDETPEADEPPKAMVARLAKKKALAAVKTQNLITKPYSHIIASDQTMTLNNEKLGKPLGSANAREQLRRMSGNTVIFYTSLCVLSTETRELRTEIDTTKVRFRALSEAHIERYLEIDTPFDCAGSFKSERAGIALCHSIEGKDPNALIGLPLIMLTDLLMSFGYNTL